MESDKYIVFDIFGIKHNCSVNTFAFKEAAECTINNDKFIRKIVLSADISKVTFYLYDSLEIGKEQVPEIVNYLSLYLGSMMIALLKNSFKYTNIVLKPTIRLSMIHLPDINWDILKDNVKIKDNIVLHTTYDNGSEMLESWVQEVQVSNYVNKNDKYDVLFLLLQGENNIQKYMAMYAYLMCIVREIYNDKYEKQKNVVKYISNNCHRVGIKVVTSVSSKQGAKDSDIEDQFTALRNKIAHPPKLDEKIYISESVVNQLASIICCAIEDITD